MFFIYLIGKLWYFVLEKPLMILANKACEHLDNKMNNTDDYKSTALLLE